jgi:3,5-epimerase/4-reductase
VKVLVFGSRGYLGQLFLEALPGSVGSAADIADPSAVAAALEKERPDIALNCAGKTGRPNVDWCEDHKEETLRANVTGPLVLLDECRKRGVKLVHLSSGCIYEGDNGGRGFTESDPPNYFGSFYSKTKAWSDLMLQDFPVLLLRMRMPFDGTLGDRNLLTKLRKYTRVLDEENSITYLPDFVRASKQLIESGATGVYNLVNDGPTSPYKLMMLYKEIVDPSHAFEKLSLADLSQVAKAGRSNCILSGEKAKSAGVTMLSTEEAARQAMESIKQELQAAKK